MKWTVKGKLPPLGPFVIPGLAAFLFIFHLTGFVNFHESEALDLRFRLRGAQKAHSQIVIVAIDDASLASVGQWPWPRGVYAAFLGLISRYQPQSIFFDILFPEKSPDPADDEKFAAALAKAGNVVLPFFYYSEKPFNAAFPAENLKRAAKTTAYANTPSDKDGRVRHVKAFLKTEQETFYAPALAMKGMQDTGKLPLDSQDRLWINYPGDMHTFEVISFQEVIAAAAAEQTERLEKLFSGRMVFLGHTATGTTDINPTPFSAETPGVIIPASLMHTVLTEKYLRKTPVLFDFVFLVLLAWAAAEGFKRFAPSRAFLLMLGLAAGYFAVNVLIFILTGWILLLYVPVVTLALTYAVTLFMKYTEIRFQREMTEREMAMAYRIQEQFLPQQIPALDHLEAAFQCRFTKQVGGDLYDWTDLGEGQFAFAAGDVSGKGMPAAIYMARTMSDFRSIQKKNKKAGEVCQDLNAILLSQPAEGMFLTLFYGVVDKDRRHVQYASAGHEPALLFRARTGKSELLKDGQGMPLAMFETEYSTQEIAVESGDCLLLYTDGVKELRDPKKQELGYEGLQKIFEEAARKHESPRAVIEELFKKMQDHQQGASPHDDRTLFCIRFKA